MKAMISVSHETGRCVSKICEIGEQGGLVDGSWSLQVCGNTESYSGLQSNC